MSSERSICTTCPAQLSLSRAEAHTGLSGCLGIPLCAGSKWLAVQSGLPSSLCLLIVSARCMLSKGGCSGCASLDCCPCTALTAVCRGTHWALQEAGNRSVQAPKWVAVQSGLSSSLCLLIVSVRCMLSKGGCIGCTSLDYCPCTALTATC